MKLARFPDSDPRKGSKLRPDIFYLFSDSIDIDCMRAKARNPGFQFEVKKWDSYRQYPGIGTDLSDKSLLFMRTGGFGDILMLSPIMDKIKRIYPTAKIDLACSPFFGLAFKQQGYIDKIYHVPLSEDELDEHDFHLHFEGTIERSQDPEKTGIEVFAELSGVPLEESEMIPMYKVSEDNNKKACRVIQHLARKDRMEINGVQTIVIQVRASSLVRTYPLDYTLNVAVSLSAFPNVRVLLVGKQGDCSIDMKHFRKIHNLCGLIDIKTTIALIQRSDLLICPDSAFVHFAAALGIPSLAFYGPFPAMARVRSYPKCMAMEPNRDFCPYMPCFQHGHDPCRKAKELAIKNQLPLRATPCLSEIKPAAVFAHAVAMLGIDASSDDVKEHWFKEVKSYGMGGRNIGSKAEETVGASA